MLVLDAARRRRPAVRVAIGAVLACAVGVLVAVPAWAKTPAEIAAETAPKVAGTPCTATASACVDVRGKKAWLIKDGKVARGPVTISTGKPGQDTPTGNVFRVYRKDKEYKSQEFKLKNGQPAPMPFAVFFQDGGIAFHAGSPAVGSSGCVHLGYGDAVAFFNFLQLGNQVQVMNGPVAAKPLTPEQLAAANANPANNGDSDRDSDGDSDNHDGDKKKHKKKKKKDKRDDSDWDE